MMFSRQLMILLACSCWWFVSSSNTISKKPQDGGLSVSGSPPAACENCRNCPYPCISQPIQPPPQLPGGSQTYAPPPPPAAPKGGNCPPVAPVICCQNSPPNPMPNSGYPYNYGNYTTESSSFSRTPCSVKLLLLLFVFLSGV